MRWKAGGGGVDVQRPTFLEVMSVQSLVKGRKRGTGRH